MQYYTQTFYRILIIKLLSEYLVTKRTPPKFTTETPFKMWQIVPSHSVHPSLSAMGGGVEPSTIFTKRGRLDRISIFIEGLLGKRGVTYKLNKKIKSEIFNDKKKFMNKNCFLSHN